MRAIGDVGGALGDLYAASYRTMGVVLVVGITLIAGRMLWYWHSFAFHWRRYRRRDAVTTAMLAREPVPYVKIQVTTRGSAGSTEVVLRGIRNVARLVEEAPAYYSRLVSVELVTESEAQAQLVRAAFEDHPLKVDALVLLPDYETPHGTQLKARGMHFAVEMRRLGWNRRPGRTFIVHYDEESVMVPGELKKLLLCLARTDKKVLEGPIYYPLEYLDASPLCRAMEANRPIGCFECRHVMEKGVPFHLHGSNLVVDEQFENELGWDIGNLDGQPFIAEDYVFGMKAFLRHGSQIFGWHGCVMLEQPPFSFSSAFRQRYRWVFGVLQGLAASSEHAAFSALPPRLRRRLQWGTRFRVATFALGAVMGGLALLYVPLLAVSSAQALIGGSSPIRAGVAVWMALVGTSWLGSVFVGAWYNVRDAGLSAAGRRVEIGRAVALAPIAGVLESSAALWAVLQWAAGKRSVNWHPTPKTKAADDAIDWKVAA